MKVTKGDKVRNRKRRYRDKEDDKVDKIEISKRDKG